MKLRQKTVEEFLKFRQMFTKLEWQNLNHMIDVQLNRKADQLKLDDLDIQTVIDKFNSSTKS